MNVKIFKVLGKRGRITIPFEIRKELGFCYNDILSFAVDEDNVCVKREKLCNNCREVKSEQPESTVTLLELLDGLSASEQRAALIHLSVKWAQKQGGGQND